MMDESLGTLLRFWGVFQFTQVQPLPSPHKQCWTGVSRVSTLYRVGGGWTAGEFWKGCTVLRGNREMTEKYEYCSTVWRTFVQDCRLILNFLCLLALINHQLGLGGNGNWESTYRVGKKNVTLNLILTCNIHCISKAPFQFQ